MAYDPILAPYFRVRKSNAEDVYRVEHPFDTLILMPVSLVAITQQTPEPHTPSHSHLETGELTAQGDDYDTALSGLDAQVPEGWRLISIRRVD